MFSTRNVSESIMVNDDNDDNEEKRLNQINENLNKNNCRNFYQIFKNKLTKYNPPRLQTEDKVVKKQITTQIIVKFSQIFLKFIKL